MTMPSQTFGRHLNTTTTKTWYTNNPQMHSLQTNVNRLAFMVAYVSKKPAILFNSTFSVFQMKIMTFEYMEMYEMLRTSKITQITFGLTIFTWIIKHKIYQLQERNKTVYRNAHSNRFKSKAK